jgi:Protein of unknown function (DUF3662)/Inner membrane component of T3SS, cytoplasmic domain
MEANRPRIELMNADASSAYAPPDENYDYSAANNPAAQSVAPDAALADAANAPASPQRRTRRGSRGRGSAGASTQRINPLQRFEGFFEGLFEGSFTRLFHSKIQPAELAHKLERAMEDGQQVSVGKVFVPNAYELELNPEDYAQFAGFKASLEHELAEYVAGIAKQRGYRMTTRSPLVRVSANEQVGRRDIRVGGRIVDPRIDSAAAAELEGEIERTRAMRIPPQYLATPRASSLIITSGKRQGTAYAVNGPLIRIGRGLDNEVVIDDARVSRHHAEIRWAAGRYSVLDLGSTNGTFLNDMQITESPLTPGDRISLGGLELMFQ